MDKRWIACLVASAACLVASVALRAGEPQQPTPSSPLVAPSAHRATLDRYCVTCHNARVKAGGLVLDTLDVASEPATWEKVVRKLRGRMMPPAALPRPDEATYDAFARDLESALDAAAAGRNLREVRSTPPNRAANPLRGEGARFGGDPGKA